MAITPIQTRYKGCHFRSRIEARWAVFFDHLKIRWYYEYEGYDLGNAGCYLPDFLLYPGTQNAMWFEVKGRFPSSAELLKAQKLARGTGLSVYVYFEELALPAPADLAEMTEEEFFDHEEEWLWSNEWGWAQCPTGPARWEIRFGPTAFVLDPSGRASERTPRSQPFWWTDCPHCGLVVLKVRGQVGWCPSFGDDVPESAEPLYPHFAHATARLQAAYTAARSARFELGAHGN